MGREINRYLSKGNNYSREITGYLSMPNATGSKEVWAGGRAGDVGLAAWEFLPLETLLSGLLKHMIKYSTVIHSHSVPLSHSCNTTPGCFMRDHLAGHVVKASTSRVEDPGFESRLFRNFSKSSHTSDLKSGTPVATLPGTWRHRVSAGTGWPSVSIL